MDSACRYCGQEIILPCGNPKSRFALIGEFPGKTEVKIGKPFVGVSGNILRQELARLGIDIDELLLANLWYHYRNENDKCLDASLSLLLKTIHFSKSVLLLGSDCSQLFLDVGVNSVSGLWLESKILKGKAVMATVNPANLIHGNIGEFRLALELFFGVRKRSKVKWDAKKLEQLMES